MCTFPAKGKGENILLVSKERPLARIMGKWYEQFTKEEIQMANKYANITSSHTNINEGNK